MCMYSAYACTHISSTKEAHLHKLGDKRGDVDVGLSKNFAVLLFFTKPATEEVPLDMRYMCVQCMYMYAWGECQTAEHSLNEDGDIRHTVVMVTT